MRTNPTPLAIFVGLAVVAALVSFVATGGSAPGFIDQFGPVERWGSPLTSLLFTLAAAVTVGGAVLTLCALPASGAAHQRAMWFVRLAAIVWVLAAWGRLVFTFHEVVNSPLFAPGSGEAFGAYITAVPLGRAGAVAVAIAGIVAALSFFARSRQTLLLTALVGFSGLVPLVLPSHSAGSAGHTDSTVAVVVHIMSASVWIGGLLVLLAVAPSLDRSTIATVVRRYSAIALTSFIALAVSGAGAGWAAVGTWEGLMSPYGALLATKSLLLVLLGLFGVLHRRMSIRQLDRGGSRLGIFAGLSAVELGVMGVAAGLATTLARTQPPTIAVRAAEALPEYGVIGVLTEWRLEPVWLLLCALGLWAYLAAVLRLRRTGVSWPLYRIAFWVVGIMTLLLVTNGGLRVYQGLLFSAHVATQMLLTVVVSFLLVLGGPAKLANLALPSRSDGSLGPREAVRFPAAIAARIAAVPHSATLAVTVALAAIYFSPLRPWAAATTLGYDIAALVALVAGSMLAISVFGSASRGPASMSDALFAAGGTAVAFATFGGALLVRADALQDPWFRVNGDPWGDAVSAAPELAGPTLWLIGGVALGIAVVAAVTRSLRTKAPAGAHETAPDEAQARPAP